MHLATSFFPRRRKPAPPVDALNPCPALPIAFTRDVALADWIQVYLGKGVREERVSIGAQILYLGRSADDEIGFVARSIDGMLYSGWEDPALLTAGPCWVAVVRSTGARARTIAMHTKAFPLPIKARPFKRFTKVTRADVAPVTGPKP